VEQVFVPAGSFLRGSEDGIADERPVRAVALDAFWLDRTEVTNDQFAAFVAATGYQTTAEGSDWQHPRGPGSDLGGLGDYPVVQVSWVDAYTFCAWAGGRLPTEAEWEYAARGPRSLVYPWGNTFDGAQSNYCDRNCPYDWADALGDDGHAWAAPVGSYPSGAGWAGALDIAGNVWEWVNDWYGPGYYNQSPDANPTGPQSSDLKVLRGGAWSHFRGDSRMSFRNHAEQTYRNDSIGLRCAGD
jgi:serine/threonine-protein kinase